MARARKTNPLQRLHAFLLPHPSNGCHPHIFRTAGVAAVILGIVALEGAYLAQIKLVLPGTNFLASVLPGALVALTNGDRATNDLPTVTEDPLLDTAAQLVAEDMAANGYFAHVSPDGKSPWYWLAQVGYKYSYSGQNLAVNFTDSEQVETAWMNSPTHRANIVKPQYTRVGIGVANGTYEGKSATFVVQYFATPAGEAAKPVPASKTVLAEAPKASGPQEQAPAVLDEPASEPVSLAAAGDGVTPADSAVLGEENAGLLAPEASPAVTFLKQVAASPMHTMLYIFSGLAVLVLFLFTIALGARAKKTYVELIGGGLVLLLLLIGLIVFNAVSAPAIQVSVTDSAAS